MEAVPIPILNPGIPTPDTPNPPMTAAAEAVAAAAVPPPPPPRREPVERGPDGRINPGRQSPTGRWSDPVAPIEAGLKTFHIYSVLMAGLSIVFTGVVLGMMWERRSLHSLLSETWAEHCIASPSSTTSTDICARLSYLNLTSTSDAAAAATTTTTSTSSPWTIPTTTSFIETYLLRAPIAAFIAVGGDVLAQLIPLQLTLMLHNIMYSFVNSRRPSEYWFWLAHYEEYLYGLFFARLITLGTGLIGARGSDLAFGSWGFYGLYPTASLLLSTVVADGLLIGFVNIKLVQWVDDYILIENWGSWILGGQVAAWYFTRIFGVVDYSAGMTWLESALSWSLLVPNRLADLLGYGSNLLDVKKLPLLLMMIIFIASVRLTGLWKPLDRVERRFGSWLVQAIGAKWLPPSASAARR